MNAPARVPFRLSIENAATISRAFFRNRDYTRAENYSDQRGLINRAQEVHACSRASMIR